MHKPPAGPDRLLLVRFGIGDENGTKWDGHNDCSVEDTYRYAIDAALFDFLAVADHNFGIEDEYDWWRSQKAADLYRVAPPTRM